MKKAKDWAIVIFLWLIAIIVLIVACEQS